MTAQRSVTIVNKRGLHARASAKLSKLAAQYPCDITLSCNEVTAPGKSILDLLMLAASKGKTVTVTCDGEQEEQALNALCDLIQRGFDENDDDGE